MRKREMQSFFNKSLKHLRKQGSVAYDNDEEMCLYRGADGSKCAIGALIPDDKYDSEWEGDGAGNVMCRILMKDLHQPERTFFDDMQREMHDDLVSFSGFHDFLESGAQTIARKYGLEYTGPK